jgi:nitrogen fixation protein NifU and related proteins
MSELRDLYQEVILDHNKSPRNFRALATPSRTAHGYNPLCGDKITVFLMLDGERVKEATFQGAGCAISTASASLMTESLRGKTLKEVQTLFGRVHELLTSEAAPPPDDLGKLAVFAGVREFPMRVKCATLAWHTLMSAMEDGHEPVSTE